MRGRETPGSHFFKFAMVTVEGNSKMLSRLGEVNVNENGQKAMWGEYL
jgi:hypothetical protein